MKQHMSWRDDLIDASTGSESSTQRAQVIAVVEGLGLTLGSVFAGIIAVLGISIALNTTDIPATDAVQLLQSRAIQVGFLAVALAYLVIRGHPRYSIQFRIPSLHGVAWILTIPLLTAGSGYILEPVLAIVGIAQPSTTTSMAVEGFTTQPLLWGVVLVGWFAFAAPAEELLFRGIIQGRLRDAFAPIPGILLAAVLFGLMHVPIAALSTGMEPASSFVETLVSGAIFGVAYERTDNLLVPSVAHAGLWTVGLIV